MYFPLPHCTILASAAKINEGGPFYQSAIFSKELQK